MQNLGLTIPVLWDRGLGRSLGVVGLTVNFIVNGNACLVARNVGFTEPAMLEESLDVLAVRRGSRRRIVRLCHQRSGDIELSIAHSGAAGSRRRVVVSPRRRSPVRCVEPSSCIGLPPHSTNQPFGPSGASRVEGVGS